jgi:hypothetical protein
MSVPTSLSLTATEQRLVEQVLEFSPGATWINVSIETDADGSCVTPMVVIAEGNGNLEGMEVDQELADRLCAEAVTPGAEYEIVVTDASRSAAADRASTDAAPLHHRRVAA